jgi:hypothetical protein
MTLSVMLEGLKPLAIVYSVLGVGWLLNRYVITHWKKDTETYTLTTPNGDKMRVTISTALTPNERSQKFVEALAEYAAQKTWRLAC